MLTKSKQIIFLNSAWPLWGCLMLLLLITQSYSQMVQSPDSASEPVAPLPVLEANDILDELEPDGPSSNGPGFFTNFLEFLGLTAPPAKQGEQAYSKQDYDKALQKFREAQIDDPESQELFHNIGNAQFKKKKYDEAIATYEKALTGNNTLTVASAYYNTGNAYFRKGEFAIQGGDKNGIQHYRTAMANYKKSLEIQPDNLNAKQNIEVVQARIKELLKREEQDQQQGGEGESQPQPKPSEKAKEVLARAMQLVKQRKYQEAQSLLENIIQEDATAISFQSHVKRIEDVVNILEGKPVAPPATQDPRSQQQGVGVI